MIIRVIIYRSDNLDHFDFPLIVNTEPITYHMLGEYQRNLYEIAGEKIGKDAKLTRTFFFQEPYAGIRAFNVTLLRVSMPHKSEISWP